VGSVAIQTSLTTTKLGRQSTTGLRWVGGPAISGIKPFAIHHLKEIRYARVQVTLWLGQVAATTLVMVIRSAAGTARSIHLPRPVSCVPATDIGCVREVRSTVARHTVLAVGIHRCTSGLPPLARKNISIQQIHNAEDPKEIVQIQRFHNALACKARRAGVSA
jgi:hypothetical protein